MPVQRLTPKPKALQMNDTTCWNCDTLYEHDAAKCPACSAANANVDFEAANKQAKGEDCE